MVIERNGDLVLQLLDRQGTSLSRYRVSSKMLQKHSDYYNALLAPGKFSEGAKVQSELDSLKSRYSDDLSTVPHEMLPIISFPELEQLEISDKTIKAMDLLLLLVHELDDLADKRSASFLAHLAVLAEQVIATEITKSYVIRYLSRLGLNTAPHPLWTPKMDEERVRQYVYLGYIYDEPCVFLRMTFSLIEYGCNAEINMESNRTGTAEKIIPPWMSLPYDIEGNETTAPSELCRG